MLCTVPSMLLATHTNVPSMEISTLAITRLPLDNSSKPSVAIGLSGWESKSHWKETDGSGRWMAQGRVNLEPATAVREREALRRMGAAEREGGRERKRETAKSRQHPKLSVSMLFFNPFCNGLFLVAICI